MRLLVIPPPVQPEVYPEPDGCPDRDCGSRHVQFRQAARKPLRDPYVHEVVAHRYQCPRCGRPFRVYPVRVSRDQTSARRKGLAVLFYVLGMSYGAVAIALEALGCPLSKAAVYTAVQEAGARVAGLRRAAVKRGGGRVVGLGVDLTSVLCAGQWLTVGVGVDAVHGLALTVDLLPNAEAGTLTAWVEELATAIGAEVLVSDDADAFQTAADANGLDQQVCKTHVQRNTEVWVEGIAAALAADADGSLAAIGGGAGASRRRRPGAAAADDGAAAQSGGERHPGSHPSPLSGRAPKPATGETMSLAYRLRPFSLDRWTLWPRLTRYRRWEGAAWERLDGTTNACERAIGWWVKERYRTMRGYQRPESVLHVSRLIAAMGNALDGPGFALAEVVA